MSVLDQLSSSLGTRTQDANAKVARRCVTEPKALAEIAAALGGKNARLVGDCAEVMTKVGEQRPELLIPHAPALLALLSHRNGRVRWESAHALALVAAHAPKPIERALPSLAAIARDDDSVIVRDYVIDAVAAYATTSAKATRAAMPVLVDALDAWHAKHAARVLRGLAGVAKVAPALAPELHAHASRFVEHHRPGIRKAARALAAATA